MTLPGTQSAQPAQTLQSGGGSDPALRAAMVRRLHRRAVVSGSMVLPAVPAMIEDYMAMCLTTFSAIGASFNDEQVAQLRRVLEGQLAVAFAASSRSEIVITYDSPVGLMVNYHVKAQWHSLDGAYDNWIATRKPPLFGSEPDAKVLALASAATDPAHFPILDIGAGTGRNALALARRGYPVDAVELAPKFADIIRQVAQSECLSVRVIERDFFAGVDDLRHNYYQLILLSEVVSDFRTTDQLCQLFERAASCLAPGGRLVFNAFLAKEGFTPTDASRELGQQCYSSIFTRSEIAAAERQPLIRESDESVYIYEKAHQPAETWPPTGWYEDWVSGQDVFDVDREASPIELRWLVYRKKY